MTLSIRRSWASPNAKSRKCKTQSSCLFPPAKIHTATARTPGPSFGSNTSASCWRNQLTESRFRRRSSARSFVAGANLLPAERALVGLQDLFAKANRFRRDFHVLVVGDKFDRLLETELAMRNQPDGLIRARRAHVGLLLFLGDVHFHVLFAGIFPDDHAFIDFDRRTDEQFAAFLEVPQCERRRRSGTVCNQRARRPQRHLSRIIRPTVEDRVDQRGP